MQGRDVERLLPSAAPACPWQGSWWGPQGCRPSAWSPAQLWGFPVKKKQLKNNAWGNPSGGACPSPQAVPLLIPEASVSLRSSAGEHLRGQEGGRPLPTVPARPALGGGSPPGGQCGSERGAGDLLGDALLLALLLGVGWGLCRVRRPSSFTPGGASLQRPLPPAPREFSVAARTNDAKPTATKQRTFIFSQSGGQKSLGGRVAPARSGSGGSRHPALWSSLPSLSALQMTFFPVSPRLETGLQRPFLK